MLTGTAGTIGTTTATISTNNVTSDGGSPITERGVVYSTTVFPTTANTKLISAGTTGTFNSSLTGLTAGTVYYLRAYATNAAGTTYGAQIGFATNFASVTKTFQEGTSSYVGTEDTHLSNEATGTNFGTATILDIDGEGPIAHGIIRFTNIVGSGASQIPSGSTVTAATLRFNVENSGTTLNVHRMLTTWTENTSTWNTLVSGIQANNTEAATTVLGTFTSPSSGSTTTASGLQSAVQAWVNGDANHGFAILPTGTNGVGLYSSEWTTTAQRPLLSVTYTPASPAVILPPTVVTGTAGSLTPSGATITANNVTSAGGGTITERGVVFSSSQNPTTASSKVAVAGTTGAFDASLTGLSANTLYYARAFATNSAGTDYGSQISFTTTIAGGTIALGGSVTARSATYGSPSTAASFTVSGTGLTGDLTVTPPAGFETSLTEGSGYGTTTVITASGTLASTTVYVRLAAATTPGNYSGNITVSGGGASSETLAIPSSTVSAKELTLTGAAVTTKPYDTTTAATITGSLSGIVAPDVVTFTGTGAFASATPGTNIGVTAAIVLSGADAAKYTIAQPTGLSGEITKASQTITFAALPAKLTTDAAFDLTATASSSLAVSYASSNEAVATVTGNTVTIVGAGSTTITASQAGDANYDPATNVQQVQSVTTGPTVLALGDISVIGFNSNAPDGFAFVTWVDLNPNTVIKFTDNGFLAAVSATAASNGRGGENFSTWTNNTGNVIPAGTVISVIDDANPDTVSLGTTVQQLNNLANGGDQIFVYQGAGAGTLTTNSDFGTNVNPSTFTGTILFGLNFGTDWLSTGTPTSNTSYRPTELAAAGTSIALTTSSTSRGQYTGARTGQTLAQFKAAVTNTANWTTATGAGTVTLDTTSFTIVTAVAPTVATTTPATSITTTTATVGGDITATGGDNATIRGVEFSTTNGFANGTGTPVTESGSFGTGTFTRSLTGLSAGTVYYFKAFATNSVGTSYGSQETFTTASPNIALGGSVSALSATYGTASTTASFTVSGTGLTGDLTVTPPAGFESSLTEGSGYGATTFITASGTLASTPVYVRLAAATAPGSYSGNIVVSGGGASSQNVAIPASTVSTKELTLSSAAVTSKEYDTNTAATITGTLSGIVSPDVVTFTGTGTFASANVNTGISVTAAIVLTGVDAAKYTILQPAGLTGDITAKNLTITGLTGNNKPYDGNATATVSGTATLNGVISPDDVTLGGTPVYTFASTAPGTGIAITTTGFTLGGAQAGNYTVTQPSLTANITQLTQTITGLAAAETRLAGAVAYNLAATSSSSLTVAYSSSDENVATISGSTVTVVGAGTTTITATQTGDTNYAAAPPITQTLTILPTTWTLIENFTGLNTPNPLAGQNGWATGTTSGNVIADPADAANLVGTLQVGDAISNYKSLAIAGSNQTATMFLRFRIGKIDNLTTTNNETAAYMGVTDVAEPTVFGNFRAQWGTNPAFSTTAGTSPFHVVSHNPAPINKFVNQQPADSLWYHAWAVLDKTTAKYSLYLQGGEFTSPTLVTQVSTLTSAFDFRNGGNLSDTETLKLFLRSGGTHQAPLYFDDIYLAAGQNLTPPVTPVHVPIIATGTSGSITRTTAEISANDVTSDGNAPITERGVVFSTSPNPTTADTKVVVSGTTGTFNASLTGLVSGSPYYVRAFATNTIGTAYGSGINFNANDVPVFSGMALNTTTDSPVLVIENKILARITDADGGPATITGVAANSAEGGTLSRNGGIITYTPALAFSGTDSFTVSVDDGFGAINITIQVTVATDPLFTSPANAPRLTALPGGAKRIAFNGIPGRTYAIQRSTTMAPGSWTQIAAVQAAADSSVSYDDPTPPQPSAFYRIAYPAQ